MDIEQTNFESFEVIVIGAGAGGIGAAIQLQKHSVPYLVLEARDRVGGRLLTKELDGIPIDLGGCWIHSYSKKNPLNYYVKKQKTAQAILTKREKGRIYIDGEIGQEFDDNVLEVAYSNSSHFFMTAKRNTQSDQNLSLYEAGKDFMLSCLPKLNPEEKRCTELLINMTEHYEASSCKELSAEHFEFKVDEGGDFLPENGYGRLMSEIAFVNNLNIRLQKHVKSIIRHEDDQIEIVCESGEKYKAKKIICNLPLGILKSKKVEFKPDLPSEHRESINRLGIGLMNKVIVSFEENFWGPVSWLSIGCNERGKFSQIFNMSQKGKHILCCFLTDDFARKMEKETNEFILESFLELLKNLYKNANIKVRDSIITKWGQDEFSLTSYTSFHAGSSPDDCYKLRTPIEDKIWFVGEHCYAEHIGTAHGAFQTGTWAAEQALNSLKWNIELLKNQNKYKKDLEEEK